MTSGGHVGQQFAGFEGETRDMEGEVGNPDHMTRIMRGTVPTHVVASMPGLKGEVPGEHRNKQGEKWEHFKADVAENGIREPLHINVDRGQPVRLYEGNHRRDAAVELGHERVPIHVQFWGHAERDHG